MTNEFENKFNEDSDFIENLIDRKEEKHKKSDLEMLKELFSKEDIETKTELNIKQIIVMNKKRMLARMLNFNELDKCLNDFMVLSISKERKGRTEFIEGFKGKQDREENMNSINNSNGINRLFGVK